MQRMESRKLRARGRASKRADVDAMRRTQQSSRSRMRLGNCLDSTSHSYRLTVRSAHSCGRRKQPHGEQLGVTRRSLGSSQHVYCGASCDLCSSIHMWQMRTGECASAQHRTRCFGTGAVSPSITPCWLPPTQLCSHCQDAFGGCNVLPKSPARRGSMQAHPQLILSSIPQPFIDNQHECSQPRSAWRHRCLSGVPYAGSPLEASTSCVLCGGSSRIHDDESCCF